MRTLDKMIKEVCGTYERMHTEFGRRAATFASSHSAQVPLTKNSPWSTHSMSIFIRASKMSYSVGDVSSHNSSNLHQI
uniref:Uncharacterized protein n=1 Tax=Onchocerca volvulus TaxID=6282 RepID=A0A8R1XX42_ONCVO